jgi:hypothetical protein
VSESAGGTQRPVLRQAKILHFYGGTPEKVPFGKQLAHHPFLPLTFHLPTEI